MSIRMRTHTHTGLGDADGHTPLHLAAASSQTPRTLLRLYVCACGWNGWPWPLHAACRVPRAWGVRVSFHPPFHSSTHQPSIHHPPSTHPFYPPFPPKHSLQKQSSASSSAWAGRTPPSATRRGTPLWPSPRRWRWNGCCGRGPGRWGVVGLRLVGCTVLWSWVGWVLLILINMGLAWWLGRTDGRSPPCVRKTSTPNFPSLAHPRNKNRPTSSSACGAAPPCTPRRRPPPRLPQPQPQQRPHRSSSRRRRQSLQQRPPLLPPRRRPRRL